MQHLVDLLNALPDGLWSFLGAAVPAALLARPLRRLERRVGKLEVHAGLAPARGARIAA